MRKATAVSIVAEARLRRRRVSGRRQMPQVITTTASIAEMRE